MLVRAQGSGITLRRLLHAAMAMLLAMSVHWRAAACDLDCSLARSLEEERLAGVAYSLVGEDGTIRVGAVGAANSATGERLQSNSRVHIGSVAKTVLALGILRLATEGRLDLDAPISGLLPGIRFDNPWRSRPVTLRHLLDHTSGLQDARLWQMFSTTAEPSMPLVAAFRKDPGILRVRTEPGRQFSYSNIGYTLAAMAIEAVVRERYESWLDHNLLAPLGMRRSTFHFVSQTGKAADPRLAWGHYDDLTPIAALPIWLRPAAQFTTTAGDMGRLARFLLGDGHIEGRPFVRTELLKAMARPSTTDAARSGLRSGYALGLGVRDRHGGVGKCHGGNIIGYRAMLCTFPQTRRAFFIVHNTDKETADYARFDKLLFQALGAGNATSPAAKRGVLNAQAWEGRYVIRPSRFEAFRYVDVLGESFRLAAAPGALTLIPLFETPQKLVQVAPRLYRGEGRVTASHALLAGPDGTKQLSDGYRTYAKVSSVWYLGIWLSLLLGVAGILFFLAAAPVRGWLRQEPCLQPGTTGTLLLFAPVPLFLSQPFIRVGDLTPASIALYGVLALLPVLMLAQVAWVWLNRRRVSWWVAHLIAALCVLQWCGVLFAWGILPIRLWAS
jgi:CubicO group peptidase (beta-lactamase class C family)